MLMLACLNGNAQVPTCGGNVPYYFVDLRGAPDSVWTSPGVARQGNCCGTSSPIRCVSFEVLLDSDAVAISFDVIDGALPPGSLFYQIGCGTPHAFDSVICLSGPGPHYLTFCKPGNNLNIYEISSVARPLFPADDTVRIGCSKNIKVMGLEPSTVTWTSVFPGARGAYNSYLSATSNTATVTVTPSAPAPTYVDYEICGFPTADECGYVLTVCDTVRVHIFPALNVAVTPFPANFCASGSGVTLTAVASGGDGNYAYQWRNPSGVIVSNTATCLATVAGNYMVMAGDGLNSPTCHGVVLTVPVTITPDPIVSAGPDQTLCPVNPIAGLTGAITHAPGGIWGGGSGTFSPSANSMFPIYTPTQAEVAAGSVTLTLTSQSAGACPNVSDAVTITFGDTLSVSIPSQTLNCYGDSATLTATIGSGNGAYSYLWNNGATSPSISTGAGTWCVTVTDALDCSDIICFNLTQPSPLATAMSSTDATTPGGSDGTASVVASGGSGPYTYLWSNGATGTTLTGLSLGIYTVTVTDNNGCEGYGSTVVNDPRCLGFTASAAGSGVNCYGDKTGTVRVDLVAGGTPPYSYAWLTKPVQLNDTAFGLGAGTYTVIVTDDIGCAHMATATVTEPMQITNAMTQTNNGVIGGTSGSATANPANGTPGYTYTWSNGQSGQTATGLAAGTYYLTITDAAGCQLTDSVRVTEPPCNNLSVSIQHTDISCNGLSDGVAAAFVSGAVVPITYAWNTGATTDSITNLPSGNYSVTVTDSLLCTNFASHTLIQPTNLSISLIATDVSCFGGSDGSVDLSVAGGTPPYTFQWSCHSESEDIYGMMAGFYSVTVTDANQCTITSTTLIDEPLPLSLTAAKTLVTCNGATDGALDITPAGGQPGYFYSWSNGATTQDIGTLGRGAYTVTLTDGNSCLLTKTYLLDEPDTLRIDTIAHPCPAPGSLTGDVTVFVSGGNGRPWELSYDGGLTFGVPGDTLATLPLDSTYLVVARDPQGCVSIPTAMTLLPPVSIASISSPTCPAFGSSLILVTANPAGGDGGPYQISFDNGTSFNPAGDYDSLLTIGTSYQVVVRDGRGCTSLPTLYAIPDSLSSVGTVSVYAGGWNVSCSGATNGTIDLAVAGGTTPYSFGWSNGATTEDLANLVAGTYSVTINDANNCTSINTFTLLEPPVLGSNGIPTAYGCGFNVSGNGLNDGGIDLTMAGGTVPYGYVWSNGATTEDLSGLPAGTYAVTATDANGCTTTNSFTLTEPSPLGSAGVPSSYNCGHNVSCNAATDGSIDLTVSGGCAPYAYAWSNGATTEDLSVLAAGTYGVTITDANGITTTNSFNLTEPATLASTGVPSGYNCGHNVSCNGATDGSIDLTVTGGCATYAYNWSNGATTEDLGGLPAGTYAVTATDANGCTTTSSFILTEPAQISASIIPSVYQGGWNISCTGATDGSIDLAIGGGCGPYTFTWSNGATTEDVSNLGAGTYAVTATDANGCARVETLTLTAPPALNLAANVIGASCAGAASGEIQLTVTGGTPAYAYLWSNGETTASIQNLPAGNYSVTVTDQNGCAASDTWTVGEVSPIALAATVSHVTCFGMNDGTVALAVTGGTSPYLFFWSNGATTQDLANLGPGTFSVLVMDGNGCQDSLSATVAEPAEISVEAGLDMTTCSTSIALQGNPPVGVQYGTWSLVSGNGTMADPSDPAAVISQLGVGPNVLTWTIHQGTCSNADTVVVTLNAPEDCGPYVLEMPTAYSPNGDGQNDYFVIKAIEHYPNNEFQVFNRWGNLVWSKVGYRNEWNGESITVGGDAPDGTYFAILVVNGGEIVLKSYVDLRR